MTNTVGRGLWFICVAATAWGTGGAVAAVLYDTSGLGPVAVSWWRFVGGVVLLALVRPFAAQRRNRPGPAAPRPFPWRSWRPMVVTGLGLALYQTAYFVSIDHTGVAVATVVTLGAGPVLIAIGARLAGIESLDGRGVAACGFALLGLVLLVGADATVDAVGVGFGLLSAAGYAAVTLLTRRGNGLDRYDAALGGFAVGAAVLLPLALLDGPLPTDGDLVVTAGLLFYLMAVPTALAYALFFAGLAVVRATTASVVALVEPVTAAAIAVTLLDERLTPMAVIGGTILLATVFLLVRSERS